MNLWEKCDLFSVNNILKTKSLKENKTVTKSHFIMYVAIFKQMHTKLPLWFHYFWLVRSLEQEELLCCTIYKSDKELKWTDLENDINFQCQLNFNYGNLFVNYRICFLPHVWFIQLPLTYTRLKEMIENRAKLRTVNNWEEVVCS